MERKKGNYQNFSEFIWEYLVKKEDRPQHEKSV